MSSYAIALSGLFANTTALDVVGDNLANMNTEGFKANDIMFEDAMNNATASLQVGAGVGSTLTSRDFTQGTIQTTNGPLDAAIQGSGFFVVQNAAGSTMYTRDGSFSLNSSGQLTNNNGDLVQGWSAVNGVLNASGPTSAISLPALSALAPSATANMSMSGNLDATTPKNGTFSTPMQVVDSLGNTHTLTVTYTETAANNWTYTVTIPGSDLTGGTASSPPAKLATGALTFDNNGNLKTPASGSPISIKTTTGLSDGALDLNVNWNLYDASGNPTLTQYAQASGITSTSQDGVQPASLNSVTLQNGGDLVATYSNGKQITVAQLALASISNPDSLLGVSNNEYMLGAGTSTPTIGTAGSGHLGNVVGRAIESSNVDMATEFTDLIVFQRGYEASSKIITTQNQMDATLLAINP